MNLRIVSLASGSKGNCTLILSDNTAILCDAGVSYTRIKNALKEFGLTTKDLSGVVVTHEHSDHIMALPKICEDTDLYAHPLTARAIAARQGALKNYRDVEYYENGFTVGDISVLPFRIPHDAAYPLGYTFSCGGRRVSVATDMGIPTRNVLQNVKDSSVVLLESNYDENMLKTGAYAPSLKARILSANGHLSNDSASLMVGKMASTAVRTVILGHISENNNCPNLALKAALDSVRDCACDIELELALQYKPSGMFEA